MNGEVSSKSARLVPSLMCMSLLEVKNDLGVLGSYFNEVHVDIMDGHFCESIHLSPRFVQEIRPIWQGSIDVHLMVDQPNAYLEDLIDAGADSIVFHIEAAQTKVNRLIAKVRNAGVKVGIAICPSTPIRSLDELFPQVDRITVLGVDPGYIGQDLLPGTAKRVQYVADACMAGELNCDVCVDGGVRWDNWHNLVACGANSLVVGRGALFDQGGTVRDACLAATAAFRSEPAEARGAGTIVSSHS